jgi:integrase
VITDEEFLRTYDKVDSHIKSQLIGYWNTRMRKMELLTLKVEDAKKRVARLKLILNHLNNLR